MERIISSNLFPHRYELFLQAIVHKLNSVNEKDNLTVMEVPDSVLSPWLSKKITTTVKLSSVNWQVHAFSLSTIPV